MPYIEFKTNIDAKNSADNLKERFGRAISIIPGKTERWLMISIEDNVSMRFDGKDDPCAIAVVSLFGSASAGDYEKLTKEMTDIIKNETGIASDRIYIKYEEVSTWGYNGANF